MKKKKFIGCIFLFALTLGFTSCLDDEDPIWYFWDEPAIVTYPNNKPMLNTHYGRFSVPALSEDLKEGDYLWTSFIVDLGNQPEKSDTIISPGSLKYKKITGSPVIITQNIKDDYTDSIANATFYIESVIGEVLFFKLEHKDTKNSFEYEMLYNPDSVQTVEGKKVHNLYIRCKPIGSAENEQSGNYHGFDISEFLSYAKREAQDNQVLFYINYKVGTQQGEDKYELIRERYYTWYFRP